MSEAKVMESIKCKNSKDRPNRWQAGWPAYNLSGKHGIP